MSQKTYIPKIKPDERRWVIFDAEDKALGRLATRVATVLRGKNKPEFTPHLDCGDGVVVINAGKVKLTGNKATDEFYHQHSGFIGGLKSTSMGDLRENNPEKLVTLAVKRMLPRNRLRAKILKHLRVYSGAEHQQQAQQPIPYDWEKDTV